MADAPSVRRIGAVGTLVWDTNWHPSVLEGAGEPLQQWGGAVYSLSSFAATCPPGWVVEPIIKVGSDLADPAFERLASLPNLSLRPGLRSVAEPNNRVELLYEDTSHRTERLTGGVPSWSYDELEPLARRLDALYLNFIAGAELGLEDALRLRAGFPGLIYGDLHSLFLGAPGPNARAPQPLDRWEEWLTCFDAVQLNETEIELLSAGREWDELVARLLEAGVKLVLVTLGGEGVRYAVAADLPADPLEWPSIDPAGRDWETDLVPAPIGDLPGDPTGCGDVWGAALLTGLLARLPLREAIVRAQRLAGAKMATPETAMLYQRLLLAVEADALA